MHLLGRHLVFKDERGATVREVPRGSEGAPPALCFPHCSLSPAELGPVHAGVVGCTPTLRPRDCFQYYSYVNMPGTAPAHPPLPHACLRTLAPAHTASLVPGPAGSMRGAYQMTTKPQQAGVPSRGFDAVIAHCKLLKDPT